jgi:hypothetical protein
MFLRPTSCTHSRAALCHNPSRSPPACTLCPQVLINDTPAVTHIVHHVLVPSYFPVNSPEEGAVRVAALLRASPDVGRTFCQLLVSAYTGSTIFPETGMARWGGVLAAYYTCHSACTTLQRDRAQPAVVPCSCSHQLLWQAADQALPSVPAGVVCACTAVKPWTESCAGCVNTCSMRFALRAPPCLAVLLQGPHRCPSAAASGADPGAGGGAQGAPAADCGHVGSGGAGACQEAARRQEGARGSQGHRCVHDMWLACQCHNAASLALVMHFEGPRLCDVVACGPAAACCRLGPSVLCR